MEWILYRFESICNGLTSSVEFQMVMEDFIMGDCKVFDCAIGAYMIAVDPCIESSLIEQDRYLISSAGGNFEWTS